MMTPAREHAVRDIVKILKRFRGRKARLGILREVKRILGYYVHEGDNNEVISRVYLTRYDCEPVRLAAA